MQQVLAGGSIVSGAGGGVLGGGSIGSNGGVGNDGGGGDGDPVERAGALASRLTGVEEACAALEAENANLQRLLVASRASMMEVTFAEEKKEQLPSPNSQIFFKR